MVDRLKPWEPKFQNWNVKLPDIPSNTSAKVIVFKNRTQRTLEWMDEYTAAFVELVEEYFANWFETILDEDAEVMYEWMQLLWWIFAHINDDKSWYFKKIFESEIKDLDLPEQFEKCLLHFIIDPEDNLNYRNLKKFLKKLSDFVWEDNPEFSSLSEYLDHIIEAVSYYLRQWPEGPLRISTHFYTE